MTVITYRDEVLACDSLWNFNDFKLKKNKIEVLHNGMYYGAAGGLDDRSLKSLLAKIKIDPEKGVTEESFPSVKKLRDLDLDTTALIVVPQNIKLGINPVFIVSCSRSTDREDDSCVISLPDEPIAIGSGSDCAMTALKRGAGAAEAVQDACEFDVNCCGPVNILEMK